ncbi:MAG: DUF4105 domain-containing protein [Propionivibrio sp.]
MTTAVRFLFLFVIGVLVAVSGLWQVLAVIYSWPLAGTAVRIPLAVLFAVVALVTLVCLGFPRWRWRALGCHTILFAALLAGWLHIEPSNERDWQTDVAVLPHATVEGDSVTVHNIRNFDYRSETDYTPAYYDKTFDLKKLEGVDLVAVYWMGPHIAHVFLSFAFAGDEHLAVSIETRKENGEDYSTLKGFFRQYELYYVVADERDVIRLRTNYRHDPPEDLYVYRMAGSIENGRRLFLEYMEKVNRLKDTPEFYNTLTTNCTTNIWMNAGVNAERIPFSWKILASGHVPELLYEYGRIRTDGLPFDEVRQRALVNARAQAADQAADFSRRIRELDPGESVDSQKTEGKK